MITNPPKNLLVFFINLHQQAKSQATSSICSRDIVDLQILQSDWHRAFQPVTLEPDFFQISDLHRNTTNNTNFHYRKKIRKK